MPLPHFIMCCKYEGLCCTDQYLFRKIASQAGLQVTLLQVTISKLFTEQIETRERLLSRRKSASQVGLQVTDLQVTNSNVFTKLIETRERLLSCWQSALRVGFMCCKELQGVAGRCRALQGVTGSRVSESLKVKTQVAPRNPPIVYSKKKKEKNI